jgi:hypothetical protein
VPALPKTKEGPVAMLLFGELHTVTIVEAINGWLIINDMGFVDGLRGHKTLTSALVYAEYLLNLPN